MPCRYYGISRTCFYRWLRRYQDEGIDGLRDRSSQASQRYARRDKRWKRYEKQQPGNRLQIDVKFIEPIGVPADTRQTTDPAAGQTFDTRSWCDQAPADLHLVRQALAYG
jgi:hypothetical protein